MNGHSRRIPGQELLLPGREQGWTPGWTTRGGGTARQPGHPVRAPGAPGRDLPQEPSPGSCPGGGSLRKLHPGAQRAQPGRGRGAAATATCPLIAARLMKADAERLLSLKYENGARRCPEQGESARSLLRDSPDGAGEGNAGMKGPFQCPASHFYRGPLLCWGPELSPELSEPHASI